MKKNTKETGAPEKPMTGNDLRTHLANERTFLAWCRTSLALIMFGFVIERFDFIIRAAGGVESEASITLSHELNYISLFAFALSGMIILISGYRFLVLRKMIRNGEMTISIFPEVMVIISMAIIVGMVIVLMFK